MSKGLCISRWKLPLCVPALWALLLPFAGLGQQPSTENPKIDQVLEQLRHVQRLDETSISPDGHWITWTQPSDPKGLTIYLLDRRKPGAQPKEISLDDENAGQKEFGVAWAPDSSRFAFFADADGSGQRQIFICSVDGGTPHRISDLSGYASALSWSPDGKRLAFLYAENGGGGGPLEAVPARTGVIGSEIHNQGITVIDAQGGATHQESPAGLNVYEYDWSPEGTRFAAIAAPGPADNNWWIAQLYVLSRNSGQMKVVYHPPADRQLAIPRWSPDGQRIGFIGGLMSDAGFVGGDIFVVGGNGGEARDVTTNRKASPSWFTGG